MSLTVASHQAHNKTRPAKAAVLSTETKSQKGVAIEPQTIALAQVATAPPAIAIIEAAAKDLAVQSEIDAPILVKFWASEKIELSPGDVAALVEEPGDVTVETQTVAEFFKNSVTVEDWMNEDEKTTARRFGNLSEVLEAQLENPRVYLFGERERTVVIIGKVKGGFGGVVTLVVET